MNAKKPKFAIPSEGCSNNLTAGKKYEISNFTPDARFGGFFNIIDNDGSNLICALKKCAHLNGKNWILRNK